MLQSLARKLNRLNDVAEIGEAIVDELRILIDYHNCIVYLLDGEQLTPVAVRGELESEDVDRLVFSLGVGLTGHVAQTGKPMLVPNVRESEICLQLAESVGDESLASVPLRYGQRVIGVITLSKLGIGQFDEDDLRLLEVLAGHASVALENARLYEIPAPRGRQREGVARVRRRRLGGALGRRRSPTRPCGRSPA